MLGKQILFFNRHQHLDTPSIPTSNPILALANLIDLLDIVF
jgi:hypothetical protein